MSPFFKVQNLLITAFEILKLSNDSKRYLNDREIDLLRHHIRGTQNLVVYVHFYV